MRKLLAVFGLMAVLIAAIAVNWWPYFPLLRPSCDRVDRPVISWAANADEDAYRDYELLDPRSRPDDPPEANVSPWACEAVTFRAQGQSLALPRNVYVVGYDSRDEAELAFERYRGTVPPFDLETASERWVGCDGGDPCRVYRQVDCLRVVVSWNGTPDNFLEQTEQVISTLPETCSS